MSNDLIDKLMEFKMAETEKFFYTDAFTPDSEVIRRVMWTPDYNGEPALVVELHNDNYYGYLGVSDDTFVQFADAGSAGRFYNWYIKGRFATFNPYGLEFEYKPNTPATNLIPQPAGLKFRVEYTEPSVFNVDWNANSLEEALSAFKEKHPDATVLGIKVV